MRIPRADGRRAPTRAMPRVITDNGPEGVLCGAGAVHVDVRRADRLAADQVVEHLVVLEIVPARASPSCGVSAKL